MLDYLVHSRFNVVNWDDAERHLRGDINLKYPVVITVDDGWRSSITELLPAFQAYKFPATVYVTTYYCDHQIPVVNVLLQYWLWQQQTDSFEVVFRQQQYHFTGDISTKVTAIAESFIWKLSSVSSRKHTFQGSLRRVGFGIQWSSNSFLK